ncbi:uncharacterized protein LOC131935460 [Physella acuta]|uniref:uncharacterized protein LOC131935460 n=1 Tax=Physella acuta TaxID=109671 RepID=UPI0027DAD925|nr:uncharacterized protein LOC131935460 [Physella acuta]
MLKQEKIRLTTFTKYPPKAPHYAHSLAAQGFFYSGSGREDDNAVTCFFCGASYNFKCSDSVDIVHKKLCSKCPMVTGLGCENIPVAVPKASFVQLFIQLASYRSVQNNVNNQVDTDSEQFSNHSQSATHVNIQQVRVGEPNVTSQSQSVPVFSSQVSDVAASSLLIPSNIEYTDSSLVTSSSSNAVQSSHQERSEWQQNTSIAASPSETTNLTNVSLLTGSAAPISGQSSIESSPEQPTVTTVLNLNNASPDETDSVTSGSAQATQRLDRSSNRLAESNQQLGPVAASARTASKPTYVELGIITERPKRSEYALRIKRVETYSGWPREHHLTPNELAEAGFFYAGYGDCARCFFCGGGLRNWEDEDNVLVEHARWFPKCAFIRQQMGQAFIDAVQDLNKDNDLISYQMVLEKIKCSGCDFNLETRDNPLQRDPAVKTVLDLGFSMIDVLGQATLVREDSGTLSADVLLEKLVEMKRPRARTSNLRTETDELTIDIPQSLELMRRIKEQNNQLRQQTVCKICMDKEVAVVFLPCGHLVSCGDCSIAMKDCPVCRHNVKGIVRAFMS